MNDKVVLSGPEIKKARKAIKPELTQEEAAKKLGITRVTYIGWEKSAALKMTMAEALKIAKIVRADLLDLRVKEPQHHVNTVAEPSIDYSKVEFEKYEQVQKSLLESKDQTIKGLEHALNDKKEEVQRMNKEKENLWTLVNKLTEGFASLNKT